MAAHQILDYNDQETTFALGTVSDVVHRISRHAGQQNDGAGYRRASSSDQVGQPSFPQENDVLDRAIRANVTVNTIDMRGLYTPMLDASEAGHQTASMGPLQQADISEASEKDGVLEEIADVLALAWTFFHNDNGFMKEGLDPDRGAGPNMSTCWDILPQNLKFDGNYHNLKVTVKNAAGMSIQARRGYWAPNHGVSAAEQSKEEIQDAVFSRDEIQDIPVALQTEFFKSSESAAELDMESERPSGSEGSAISKSRGPEQRYVDRGGRRVRLQWELPAFRAFQRVMEMHLRDQTLATLQNSGMVVKGRVSASRRGAISCGWW